MSARRKKKKEFPAWHPDYRIAEDLPDIKAVRTDFLINAGALALALALVVALAYREISIFGLENEIQSLEDEEKRLEGDNMRVVSLNTRFMKRKRIHDDLEAFYDAPFDVPRFFADVARIRPGEIAFEEISYLEAEEPEDDVLDRTYRLFFRGQTRSLKVIDEFKTSLAELPYLEDIDATISEGANPRNPVLETFGFSLEVRFQPNGKDKG